VTICLKEENDQFIIHIKDEYDYLFKSKIRQEIIDALKYVYFQTNHQNLPIYGINEKLGDNHMTTKSVIKNG
jgi:hypothetical protein